ncbi:DUF4288 domain-containing protein [Mucilaginibacter sp. KACC 22063]|uniref:DUF4288 domain-containing protein n=1 Tax=Mucilaginibacter sp. KACC 22063 TaxID=3025666 RepID=UPI00236709FE|nr:DUF4288 domain-containing protein [Mucilaginibacter sp. KACC 22063]WDF56478.1 DUF4288 domain-containing protein [Mucilaginibacter sp. KACC 22063]
MNWYVAKIIFRILCNDGNCQAQFDEQLRLISAQTKSEAFEKAIAFGRQNEDRFLNDDRQKVKWSFVNVADINEISGLKDGVELYSNIHEATDADLYVGWANHKAALLQLEN